LKEPPTLVVSGDILEGSVARGMDVLAADGELIGQVNSIEFVRLRGGVDELALTVRVVSVDKAARWSERLVPESLITIGMPDSGTI
jgi:hypothetical protein